MRRGTGLLAAVVLIVLMLMPVSAAAIEASDMADIVVFAVLTDEATGEKTSMPVNSITSQTSENSEDSFTEEAIATFSFPQTGMQKRYSDTSITETDVKATVKINYDRSGDKIRVNSVSGGWVPSSTSIRIYNREVDYGDGAPFGASNSAHQYPTANSFSYTTGWGWVTYYPASSDAMSGARAFTSASVEITGMSPHTIEVFVTATH